MCTEYNHTDQTSLHCCKNFGHPETVSPLQLQDLLLKQNPLSPSCARNLASRRLALTRSLLQLVMLTVRAYHQLPKCWFNLGLSQGHQTRNKILLLTTRSPACSTTIFLPISCEAGCDSHTLTRRKEDTFKGSLHDPLQNHTC